jgi:outer membrane immunogenic protein
MTKRFGLAVASMISFAAAGPAMAADLAARPYVKAPPPVVAVYNWTGFYIGANGGYGWGRISSGTTVAPFVSTAADTSGGLAGGQIGYNWQVQNWVFGLEADGDWADVKGSALCPNPAFDCAANTRALATFRGRIGWAIGPTLLYATGGLGYANTRYSTLTGGVPAAGTTGYFTSDRWGWAAGAGVEYGFTPNWSAKLEYMHYGFDDATAPIGTLSPGVPVFTTLRIDTIKAGINYRFGGPVVAKY